jgi:hypothetical protein
MFNPFTLLDRPQTKKTAPLDFVGLQRDPFAAIPARNPLAECRTDSHGCGQIKMRLDPEPGMKGRMFQRLGFHRDVRLDLDVHGSFFWSQVDGKQNLRVIEGKIRDRFSLNQDESEKATLLFAKTLMLRYLIHLDIGEDLRGYDKPTMEATCHV